MVPESVNFSIRIKISFIASLFWPFLINFKILSSFATGETASFFDFDDIITNYPKKFGVKWGVIEACFVFLYCGIGAHKMVQMVCVRKVKAPS